MKRRFHVKTTSGETVLTTKSFSRAVDVWIPGTWLGQGVDEKTAEADVDKQISNHRKRMGLTRQPEGPQ